MHFYVSTCMCKDTVSDNGAQCRSRSFCESSELENMDLNG